MKSIIFTIAVLFSFNVLAQEQRAYYTFLYKVEEEDTFASILRLYVKDDAVINKTTPLVEKNMKSNPQIKDWRRLTPGAIISLYIPDNMLDMEKYKTKSRKIKSKNDEVKKVIQSKNSAPEGFKGSAFYMASRGDFTQTHSNQTRVQYDQNSLATVGFQGSYFPKDKPYAFSSSIYYSSFTDAKTDLPPHNVSLPAEIGFNAYAEYLWKKPRINWHAGIDYEKFSTFDLDAIADSTPNQIYLDRLSVIYATVGLSHAFTISNMPFYTKLSFSKSISTNTTHEYSASEGVQDLSGTKILLYLNYKFTNKIFFHSLIKIHRMSGASELSSTRLGLGLGYILF